MHSKIHKVIVDDSVAESIRRKTYKKREYIIETQLIMNEIAVIVDIDQKANVTATIPINSFCNSSLHFALLTI